MRRSRFSLWFLVPLLAACTGGAGQSNADPPSMGGAGSTGSPPDTSLLGAVVARGPAADASDVCADTVLRLGFDRDVKLGTRGVVRVFRASQPEAPVDSIDLAASDFTMIIAARGFRRNLPIDVEGPNAWISLKNRALTPGESYFVTIDPGVFLDAQGAPLGGLTDPAGWSFSTRAPAPADPAHLTVAWDGSADFCSVQGAVDFIPPGNTARVVIDVKNGTYREIVFIAGKHNITLRGEDRKLTRIAYANNENLQMKLGSKFRAMVEVEDSNGFILENLTLHNLTPQGGSQAEALRIDPGIHAILRNADFLSFQDTLQLSGSVYVEDSYIEGNVDFIWGKGTVYFNRCEIKTVGRAGYVVQSRNFDNDGYVFVDSKLTADPGITGNLLARIEVNRFPKSHVAYVNCQMGSHIDPRGWLVTGGTDTSMLRFWEYRSTDLGGEPIDVSARDASSRQLSDEEAEALRDPSAVLGWTPSP